MEPAPEDDVSSLATSPSRRKTWLMTTLKAAILIVVLWAIRRTIYDALDQLHDQTWHFHPGWAFLAGGLYLVGLLPAALFWHRLLLALGQGPRLGESLRAYFLGHLGKYVPGKAMVVVIRTGLIRSPRVSAAVAAVSVFSETLTMMAVGACMAAAIVAVWFRDQLWLCLLSLGLMVVAGLPTLPPVFSWLVRLTRIGRFDPAAARQLGSLGYGILLFGWITLAIGWVIMGLSFWATLRAMGAGDADPLPQLPLYTAGVCLATVVGFLSPLPGGAVIREAVLTEFMVANLGGGIALASAVLLRLVWLVSELGISIILYIVKVREKTS